jgi:hypothetical protein
VQSKGSRGSRASTADLFHNIAYANAARAASAPGCIHAKVLAAMRNPMSPRDGLITIGGYLLHIHFSVAHPGNVALLA